MKHKLLTIALSALTGASMMSSCGDGRKAEAEALKSSADSAVAANNYELAITLLDSLDSVYRDQTEVRRSAMGLRARAIEGETNIRIKTCDSLLTALQTQIEELQPLFTAVPPAYAGGSGFMIYSKLMPSTISKQSGVEPRISTDDNMMTLMVNNQTGGDFNRIAIKSGSESVSTETISSSRIVKEGNSRLVTLLQEETDTLAIWLDGHPAEKYTLVFDGGKKPASVVLKPVTAQALVKTYQYAKAMNDKRSALIMREKLERQLALSRSQQTTAAPETPEE